MTLSTIRSSENLFAMDVVAGPEQTTVPMEQQQSGGNDNDDTDKMVCHVDFVHLLQAAARLKKLLEVTSAYGNTSNHQANAKEIVDAVVGLYEEFLEHKQKNAPTIQRNVDGAIDSTIDQCLEILNKEIDWCVEIIKNNKKKRAAAQQEKDKAPQPSSSPSVKETPARPVTPDEQQVDGNAPKKTVPQHVEEAEEDVWERMVEAVSDSFEGYRDDIKQQMVGGSASNDETDPLLLFANNWSDVTADQETVPMDISNDDDLSVQILSTEEEEDPLVWFAEYWGAPEQQQEKMEPGSDYFLEPAELQDAMMI